MVFGLEKIFLKKKLVELILVVGGIVTSGWLDLDVRELKLLGEVPPPESLSTGSRRQLHPSGRTPPLLQARARHHDGFPVNPGR